MSDFSNTVSLRLRLLGKCLTSKLSGGPEGHSSLPVQQNLRLVRTHCVTVLRVISYVGNDRWCTVRITYLYVNCPPPQKYTKARIFVSLRVFLHLMSNELI